MNNFEIANHRMFRVDHREYLFLASENAIFEMDGETRDMVNRLAPWTRPRGRTREEFLTRLRGSDADRAETFDRLSRTRVIVPSGNGVSAGTDPAQRPSIPLKTLVLHVTEACNLGCRYCYYHGGEHRQGGASMTPEVAERAVDFLLDHSGPLEGVTLVFFGGEPLLNFRLISRVVTYAAGAADDKGKKIDFAITSNGTLFTEKVVDFLHENDFCVTVSMDGLPRDHDRYRRFPDGSPSYEVILPGVERLLRNRTAKPVVARVTAAGDPRDLSGTLDHLLEMGFSEVGFAPVTTGDPAFQLDPERMHLLLGQFEALSHRFLDAAREDLFFGFTNLVDLLVVLHEGEVKSHPCGAGLGLFAAGADGRLYLCQRLNGHEASCMGDLFTGFDEEKIDRFRKSAEISKKNGCRRCWARAICAGGCYHEALVRQGDLLKPNLHYCDWIMRWIETGLAVYGRLAADRAEYLDKLSALRGHAVLFNQIM